MKRVLLPLSLLITALWALSQSAEILTFAAPFLDLRKALTILSGALALGWMSYSMLLALRPVWLEQWLGGLDKLFVEHKWAGIGSVLWVVTHWLIELSPRTLVAWGWVTLPPRAPRGSRPPLDWWIALARQLAEPAAWLMIALGIVALLRFVPYSWFRKLHKLFPIAFLMGAYHSVFIPGGISASALGAMMVLMAVFGSGVAVMSLASLIGRQRRVAGRVSHIEQHASGVIDLRVQPTGSWPGHRAGQFALLTLDRHEGPHPFTIASDWQPGSSLRFTIKPLGDYTCKLAGSVKPGDVAQIEGPFGGFDFGTAAEPQLWVAGGIGIAPFLARLDALAVQGGAKQRIVLFYSVRNEQEALFPVDLPELCARAGVELLLRVESRDGRFNPAEIALRLSAEASVWFCGPARWGDGLKRFLRRQNGLGAQAFHQEIFEFR
ncbi:ferric reductase-like transmembrane domain-containing protein [Uliginosibacterium sp. 31-16]|uniref:ferredoxin reductase family protein n=1 Tax=Uliginosibacterium sp. 31-16 TaxID=3068315 RepID=UPI00273FB3CA|nr:ferric reductase-like transmembrane domain-containing protein [Uliginosibacterium sp. 31-16]MDP5239313.1 ferric reductase-like transmembrane domain-containing protein [Uliginosibacterium sp. 31-16]